MRRESESKVSSLYVQLFCDPRKLSVKAYCPEVFTTGPETKRKSTVSPPATCTGLINLLLKVTGPLTERELLNVSSNNVASPVLVTEIIGS